MANGNDPSTIPSNKYPLRVNVLSSSGTIIDSFGGGAGTGDVNLTQLAGVAIAAGAGNVNSGTQRVILATDQVLPLPTGAATAASQSTTNTSLGTILTNTTGIATAANQTAANSSLSTIVTDVTPLVTSGGGGYIRQDSTATIAKETGGNLATIAAAIKAEDAASASGDSGLMLLTVRRDAAATSADTTGDYATLNTDNTGRLWVNVAAVTASTTPVSASTATGAAVPANALYMGANDLSTGNLIGIRTVSNSTNTGSGILGAGLTAVLDDTSPTAITENQFGVLRMSADRTLLVTERSTTPTQTTVAASASSVSILAANNARKGATITNDSSVVLYLKLGATASTTSYTLTIAGAVSAPFAYYELPFGYVGAVDGISASATGNYRVTELT